MTTPNIGLTELANGQANYLNANDAFARIDALLQTPVISKTLTAAPASPANGALYIMASAWAGITGSAANKLALWRTGSGWLVITPKEGWRFEVAADEVVYRYDGATWGATATDAQLRDRSTHTGTQPASTISDFTAAAAAAAPVQSNDSRLTDAREWTAIEVPQVEAEAGTATTARKWSSLRVRQAVVAWWGSISGAAGRELVAREYVPFSFAEKIDSQAIPAGPFTKVNYGQSVVNTEGNYSSATSVFTAPFTGSYLVYASALFEISSGQRVALAAFVNGSQVITLADFVGSASSTTIASGTSVLRLNVGDAVSIWFASVGVSETLGNNPINSKFIVRRL